MNPKIEAIRAKYAITEEHRHAVDPFIGRWLVEACDDVAVLLDELRYLQGERAAVVAWLDAHLHLEWCDCCGQQGTTISEIANAIERGQHRSEEER